MTVVPLDLAHPEILTREGSEEWLGQQGRAVGAYLSEFLILSKRNSKLVGLCEPSSNPFINY